MLDHIPPTSLLHHDLPAGAYQDCCIEALPATVNIEQALLAFFGSSPAWLLALMALRNRLVTPLGLKTARAAPGPVPTPFRVGQRIGIFRILALDKQEVVLGENDSHLDFRTSLQLLHGPAGPQLAMSSWVKTHNAVGVCYFALVRPFHRLIVPIMARATVRRLSGIAG
ncbi:DUF2867 domain-containing protein [Microvirgula aerodenitrificans]|uniref:DUF2867 domain-containing protein n=1 Tax=Microvirgula aerodenitrificans TaxID=57480 RepID=UPI0028EB5743|nr:DUF2867 domain-containing protein [Microvirgula aerodenitrificans]